MAEDHFYDAIDPHSPRWHLVCDSLQQESEKEAFRQLSMLVDGWELIPDSRAFLTPTCLRRYLRARNFHVKKTASQLQKTIEWREEYHPELIDATEVRDIAGLGGFYTSGHDKYGNPVFYLKHNHDIPYSPEKRLQYLVYCI